MVQCTQSAEGLHCWLRLIGCGVVTLLISTACGGSASSASDGSATSSPLEDLVGVPLLDDNALDDWVRDREIERQELIAICMLEEGFEYRPETRPDATLSTDLDRTSREFAQEFGYGVAAGFLATNYDPERDYSTENSRLMEAFSEQERDAYNLALHGNVNGADRSGRTFLPQSGCDGEASSQAFRAAVVLERAYPSILESGEKMFADSRMVDLVGEWSRCMAQAGYPQESPLNLQVPFFEGITEIVAAGNSFEFPPSELPPEVHGQTAPIMGQFDGFGVLPSFNDTGQAKMDDLLEVEIGTAVADFDCSSVFDERAEEVSDEYQGKLLVTIEGIAGES